ncbi:Excinuclease ABC subunit A [Enhygromyxa salina]|uniref:UvrABC system protein A n=1 Tax=Enhygromyxa salina TaxID=215803 RepID=A0A0C2DBH1_9BACT|nr:excinuclease ABC subunit UvrA [Enhygromyxa salina]KIG18765.1 Excinuclease ABC subunit A [Enhygromyxa salina]
MSVRDHLPAAPRSIRIRGARTHNLRDVDVELPRDALIVITGPSGSGKSSLAFDTIFAEGQRRYVESLSASARQFLAQLPKPDVDLIEGLSPTIALQQENRGRNPRSTVGTTTEVYDFLRLLFARIGEVYSWRSGEPMRRHSVEEMIDAIEALPPRSKFSVVAPVARGAPGDHRELLEDLRRQGFVRVAIDEQLRDLDEDIELDPMVRHDIDVYVDRLVLKPGIRSRLSDSIEVALRLTDGRVEILPVEGEPLVFCEYFTDFEHGLSYPPITPGLFSFNSPDGACPTCGGLGRRRIFDPRRLIPDPHKSIKEGAIAALDLRGQAALGKQLAAVAAHYNIDLYAPWSELDELHQITLLQGSGDQVIAPLAASKSSKRSDTKKSGRPRTKQSGGEPFPGLIPLLEQRLREAETRADADPEAGTLAELEPFMSEVQCSGCDGQRLRIEARHVKIGGRNIHELATMPIDALHRCLTALVDLDVGQTGDARQAEHAEIAAAILAQALARLAAMIELGLAYLSCDRATMTLSGGEAQRIRLATQIGSALVGVTYVLDEPSIGLHQRDNARLIAMLIRLRDLGNTVIVVEHDADTIRAAEYVVDMGPGAGVLGGEVVFAGTVPALLEDRRSRTAAYLSGRARIERPTPRRAPDGWIEIVGARGHNLRNVTAKIPLGHMTCVTGVSGSGKSSLIVDTLLPEAQRRLNRANSWGLEHDAIRNLERCDRVVAVDQSPIGRSPRSNPATYTGVFTELRNLYAQTNEARMRGFTASRFSFNVKGGRCEHCHGEGLRRIEMHFLADVWVTCRVCEGRRYERETLSITYRGKNIAEALDMPIAEAAEFFANHAGLRTKLEVLRDVGLGYMTLGQPATTLSGGEAQRIKLARELARRRSGRNTGGATPNSLYILDEPTTGLHFDDVRKLLEVLERLVDEGNTVVVIEHDLDVIKCADWVIDVGPEGGDQGGRVVASGPPEQIAKHPDSVTGRFIMTPT